MLTSPTARSHWFSMTSLIRSAPRSRSPSCSCSKCTHRLGGGCVHLVFLPSGLAHITSISSMRRHRRPIRVTAANISPLKISTVSSAHHMAKHKAGNSCKTLTLATVLKKATVRLRHRILDKRTVPDRRH